MSEEKSAMLNRKFSRRELLRKAALGGAGVVAASVAAACATPTPQVIKETVVVEKEKVVEKVATPTPPPAKTVEVTWWQAPIWFYDKELKQTNAPPDELPNEMVRRFQEANPNIKVKLELIPWDAWGQKTTTAFATGDMPNVIYGGGQVAYIQAGLYEPLDDYISQETLDGWLPGIKESVTFFNRIYGAPGLRDPQVVSFSKTALEKYGGADLLPKDPDRDLTFDVLKEIGLKFSDGQTRFGFGVPTDHGSAGYWGFGAWLGGFDVKIWSDDFERFIAHEQDAAVEALQWYVDAQDKWKILIPNLPKWSDVDNFYWKKNCAARFHWMGIQTELDQAIAAGQAEKPFELYYTIPPHKEGVPARVDHGGGIRWSVGRTKDKDKREAAAKLALWLGTDPWRELVEAMHGRFPVTKKGAEVAATVEKMQNPNFQWGLKTYLVKYPQFPDGMGSRVHVIPNARTSKIFNEVNFWDLGIKMIQALLTHQLDPKGVLMEMAKVLNGALGAKI